MADTTLEEAGRCPKCKQPGKAVTAQPRGEAGTVYVYQCENERCRWNLERWFVQVRADGSIPDRTKDKDGLDREFQIMSPDALSMGQRLVEDAVQQDLRNQTEREP